MPFDITPCQLNSEIVNVIAAIAEDVGRLEGVNLKSPSPRLKRDNRIQTIHASLAIEGNTLSRDQVTAVMDGQHVIGPTRDILEVQNALTAYSRIQSYDPFRIDSLLTAHGVLMKGLIPDAGSFRQSPIGVLREKNIFHEAPHWSNVNPMMQALFEYVGRSDDHPLIVSSRFHFQLEHIHPFSDGNGRIGRFWQTRILMAYHPIFEFLQVEQMIRAHQRTYYRMLAKGDDSGDCTEFVEFILSQLQQSLKIMLAETRGVTLTADKRLEIARTEFGENTFSRKAYQNLLKTISSATASRDLKRGVQRGWLKRIGDKRTSVYRFEAITRS